MIHKLAAMTCRELSLVCVLIASLMVYFSEGVTEAAIAFGVLGAALAVKWTVNYYRGGE